MTIFRNYPSDAIRWPNFDPISIATSDIMNWLINVRCWLLSNDFAGEESETGAVHYMHCCVIRCVAGILQSEWVSECMRRPFSLLRPSIATLFILQCARVRRSRTWSSLPEWMAARWILNRNIVQTNTVFAAAALLIFSRQNRIHNSFDRCWGWQHR